MWTLRSLTPGAEDPYHLLVGVEYVVGRKNCAILLHNDQSISRSHAVLLVSHPIANLSQTASIPVLTLKDTSKYGTFVNEERLQNDSPRSLKSGEMVVFGIFQSKFRVGYKPLIVCSSCLVGPGKITLNQAIQQLGGHVTSNWTNDNTHLVMPSIKITVKTICAMICGRPIVKPQFFLSVAEAIRSRQHFPSAESFSPPIDEPNIKAEDMVIKPERKWIFVGKTFIFFNGKQHKRLGPAVTLGGGNVKLIEEKGPNLSLLEAPGSCVIDVGVSDSQTASDSTKKWIDSALITLQRKGLRTISEAEVGLAVIHISTDIYCNPLSNPNSGEHDNYTLASYTGLSSTTTAVTMYISFQHEKLFNEAEYNEMLPSKLLLTVFKTLVNHTRQKIVPTSNADNSQVKNFKKFRKVLYPGGEGLPRIIGGTDLKAYQTKNNSEMEEWLRQEIEEQSQQAKDDILADDLFSLPNISPC
uniref:Nibrin n=1 Tax=Callorhinchus milii TaxID=7868 RepID=A0A4W3IF49_CALMI